MKELASSCRSEALMNSFDRANYEVVCVTLAAGSLRKRCPGDTRKEFARVDACRSLGMTPIHSKRKEFC